MLYYKGWLFETVGKPPSLPTKIFMVNFLPIFTVILPNGTCSNSSMFQLIIKLVNKNARFFSFQDLLPWMLVPSVKDTLRRVRSIIFWSGQSPPRSPQTSRSQRYSVTLLRRQRFVNGVGQSPLVPLISFFISCFILLRRQTFSSSTTVKSPLYSFFQYLRSIRPLVNDEDYEEYVKLAGEFETTIAPSLQKKLWLKWLTSRNYVSNSHA